MNNFPAVPSLWHAIGCLGANLVKDEARRSPKPAKYIGVAGLLALIVRLLHAPPVERPRRVSRPVTGVLPAWSLGPAGPPPRPSSAVSSSGSGLARLPGPRHPRHVAGPRGDRAPVRRDRRPRHVRPRAVAGCDDVHDRDLVQARRRRFDSDDRRRRRRRRAARDQGDGGRPMATTRTSTTSSGSTAKRRVLAADFEDTINGANHPVFGVTPICGRRLVPRRGDLRRHDVAAVSERRPRGAGRRRQLHAPFRQHPARRARRRR